MRSSSRHVPEAGSDGRAEVALRHQMPSSSMVERQLRQGATGGAGDGLRAAKHVERGLMARAEQDMCLVLVLSHRAPGVRADAGVGDEAFGAPRLATGLRLEARDRRSSTTCESAARRPLGEDDEKAAARSASRSTACRRRSRDDCPHATTSRRATCAGEDQASPPAPAGSGRTRPSRRPGASSRSDGA